MGDEGHANVIFKNGYMRTSANKWGRGQYFSNSQNVICESRLERPTERHKYLIKNDQSI